MKKFASANKYKYIRDLDSFYGQKNGYYFYSEKTKYVGLIRVFFTVEEANMEKLSEICSNYRAAGRDGIRYESGRLILELKTTGFDEPAELNRLLDDITRELSFQGVRQCSMGMYSDLGLYREGTHLVVKNEKVFSHNSKTLSKVYKKQSSKPALTGFLMAFVFMIPGVILYAIAIQIGIIPSIVSFSIVYLAIRGFSKASGDPSRNQLYVLLAISYVGIVLGNYVATLFSVGFTNGLSIVLSIPITFFLKDASISFVIALAFNYYRLSEIFNGAREGKVVNRKVQRLM